MSIERKIIIGAIVSTEYLQRIRSEWDIDYMESQMARRLSRWVFEYFEKYNKAPGRDIESIYLQKIKDEKLDKELAEEIERDILPKLSEEYENEDFNVPYLLDQTFDYFKERKLEILSDTIEGLIEAGKLKEAEELALQFKPILSDEKTDLDLSDKKTVLKRVSEAFKTGGEILIRFSGALGDFLNLELVRGGFVAFMGSEKRGKTFFLIELALRACKQGRKVAFFQAGDMTEAQQLKRIGIYLTRKSDKIKYIGEMYEPVRDCILNQLDLCEDEERECDVGVFEDLDENKVAYEVTQSDIIEAFEENPDYKNCYYCDRYKRGFLGVPWVRKIKVKNVLKVTEAKRAFNEFFVKNKRTFKLSSHANGTLTVQKMETILDVWKREEGFEPDIIITDYADLFDHHVNEFRHKQNEIWKAHRALSQTRNALVITVTQSDADSYSKNTIGLGNFSEDKRKYGHVTAMFGLNQDREGREKKIGIMRLNDLVKREDDYSVSNQVTILQNLRRGRPVLGSYNGKRVK